ncbi:MAG: energy-coupled thiamine transporter ThiT [Lachnospiraceae bacterium]|nr:energy-coupled thiamine transporter ThiT [Lachnospiraceae bacterium]
MSQTKKVSIAKRLAEAALLIAMGTVLSVFKLIDLPYGGSVTVGSMLPVLIIAYRYGTGFGMASSLAFGIIQQLLGLKTLSYVTTWQSILAVILLDYIVAFMVIGLGGLFRKLSSERLALVLGALLACILRFACHFTSGITVWKGISIPMKAAVIYSLGYNATYMIPETVIFVALAWYIGSVLDFRGDNVTTFQTVTGKSLPVLKWIGGLLLAVAVIIDVRFVFSNLQNGETGDFDITGLSRTDWKMVIIISAVAVVAALTLFIVDFIKNKKNKQSA